jgi:hypothetical protein
MACAIDLAVSRFAKTLEMRIPVPVLYQDAKGTVVGISPYDYAAWTSILNNKEVVVSEALKGVTGKGLWVAGRIAHPARTAIESRGWVVHDRVREKLIK